MSQKSREQLLKEIGMHSFAAFEISLFLDNHPNNAEALSDRQKHMNKAKEAIKEYEARYGALKMEDIPAQNRWTWIDDPWPWNNERNDD